MKKGFILLVILGGVIMAGCSSTTVDSKEAEGFGKPSADDAKKEAEGVNEER